MALNKNNYEFVNNLLYVDGVKFHRSKFIKDLGTQRVQRISNRCGAKNSAREEFLSATPIFWLLGYFGYFFAVLWLFFVALI